MAVLRYTKKQQGRIFLSRLLYVIGLSLVLWIPFNGIRQTLTQESSINQLAESLIKKPEEIIELQKQLAKLNDEPVNSTPDPFAEPDHSTNLYQDAVGFIDIPKIGERMALFMGASDDHLARGAAHVSGTSLPLSGKGSNSIIAGHRGWYGNNYFVNLNQMAPGDLIYISYLGKEKYYVVTNSELIDPSEVNRLHEKDPNKEEVTLLTCDPLFYTWNRLLVHTRALNSEEEKMLLGKHQSFEDLEKKPISWNKAKQKGSLKSQEPPYYQTTLTKLLFAVQPYQYFLYWALLGGGMISWLYVVWQLVKQIGRIMLFVFKKLQGSNHHEKK